MRTRAGRRIRGIGCTLLLVPAACGVRAEVLLHGGGALPGPDIVVPAAVGQGKGGNLFHSFSVFNVLAGERVTFTSDGFAGDGPVRNVISRVTGGTSAITGLKSTLIDGPLTVAIPQANFYFINPNGVVFGASGSVHVDGSVHIGTADRVRLEDGGVFAADPDPAQSVLTAAAPSAFGFLGPDPAPIQVNGTQLAPSYDPDTGEELVPPAVPPGATFALVGGDIEIADGAALVMPGATVSLASVASAGEATFSASGAVGVDGFAELGPVRLGGASLVDVTGDGAGSVYIRGGRLTLAPAGLVSYTSGDHDGGVIDVRVRGDLSAETDPGSGIVSVILGGSYGFGAGPGVEIEVGGTLTVSAGSFVVSETYGPGLAGDLHVVAGAVEVRGLGEGEFTGVSADNYGDGSGPSLYLETGSLQVLTGGFVGTGAYDVYGGAGDAGALTVVADSVLLTGTGDVTPSLLSESVGGAAGALTLTARTVELRDGARISASTGGGGDAGALTVSASEQVTITGVPSGVFSVAASTATGNAGTLSVATPTLRVDGGVIDSSTLGDGDAGAVLIDVRDLRLIGGGQVRSFSGGVDLTRDPIVTVGTGRAGSVTVRASASVSAAGRNAAGAPSGLLAQTRGPGAGGDVQVVTPSLVLSDGALIGADTGGTGDAGQVRLQVGDASLSGGARVSSDSGITVVGLELPGAGEPGGAGGTVTLIASGEVTLAGPATRISTSTRTSGDGGNVAIQARRLVLSDRAEVSASSTGTGLAGDIAIELGDSLRLLQGASIATEAFTSDGGNVVITAPRLVDLRDSTITTSVRSGTGGGGNIFIDPDFVVLQNSEIIANAFGGPGGNIQIIAGQLLTDPASLIDASSALGIDGTVNIEAPDTDVSGRLAVLPESFLDAASQLRAGCGAARSGLSSLVQVGRGGVAPEPDGYLPSLDLATRGDPAVARTAPDPQSLRPAGPSGDGPGVLALAGPGCAR